MCRKISCRMKSIRSLKNLIPPLTCVQKKIIILELLGLVLVDKDYDVKEKNFMYQLSNELGIQTDVLEEMSAKLHSYLQLCEELGELVLK